MVAALAYAFLPFHVAHATGHPHVAQTQWLPLYFLALWRCMDCPGLLRALLLVASAAAVVLSNFYGGFIAAVLTPVAFIAYAVVSPRQGCALRWRRLTITALTLAATLAIGLLVVHRMAPEVLLRPGAFAFPRSDLFLYSARLWSYLVPTADHPLVGSRVRDFWAGRGLEPALLEQQVGVGWSLLALAAVSLRRWLRGDRASLAVRSVPVLTILGLAAFVCSLSPERASGPFTFVRPSALLYEIAPMFRAYARFGVVVGLTTALMAGAGAAHLWQCRGRAGRITALLLLSLAALEFAPLSPGRWRDVLPTLAHRWLAEQPGALRVLDCVSASGGSSALVRLHFGHELSSLGPPFFEDCSEPRLGDKLAALGYTHVIVRRDTPTEKWLRAKPVPERLERGPAFQDAWILSVKTDDGPRVFVRSMLGFYPRQYDTDLTWRWMGQMASLQVSATRMPVDTVLKLDLMAFPHRRRVEAILNGVWLGELEVATEWRQYDVPLGILPGESTLNLVCLEPVLPKGNGRVHGLAVGKWQFDEVGAGDGERTSLLPSARSRTTVRTSGHLH